MKHSNRPIDKFYQPWVELSGCKRYGKGMFTTIYPELAQAIAKKERAHGDSKRIA